MFNCCFPETPAEDVRQQPWLDSLRTGDRFGVAYGIYRWGIDVNQKIVSRGTGLAQWTQIVSQLLKAKADVTQEDNFGVLHFVCSKHVPNSDIVKLLVTAKANLYFQSPPSNHTVFHVLAGYSTPYHINIAGYLLSQTSPWELWKEDSQIADKDKQKEMSLYYQQMEQKFMSECFESILASSVITVRVLLELIVSYLF